MRHPIALKENILYKSNSEETIEQYKKWRDESINKYNLICNSINQLNSLESKVQTKNIEKISNCMVRLTWEFCSCDRNCTEEINKSLNFGESCDLINHDNLKVDTKELDCDFLRIKVIDEKSLSTEIDHIFLNTENKIFSKLAQICRRKPKDEEVLNCIANYLTDEGYVLDFKKEEDSVKVFSPSCDMFSFSKKLQRLNLKTKYLHPVKNVNRRNKRSNDVSIYENDFSTIQYNYALPSALMISSILVLTYSFLMFKKKDINNRKVICVIFVGCILFLLSILLFFN